MKEEPKILLLIGPIKAPYVLAADLVQGSSCWEVLGTSLVDRATNELDEIGCEETSGREGSLLPDLEGTWVKPSVSTGVGRGYLVVEVYEVWLWE